MFMDFYSFIIQNKEIFKLVYSLIIVAICLIIVFRSNKFFRLSLHNGIRYFRNAFLFFAVGFFIRYIIKFIIPENYFPHYNAIITSLFEFFLITGGFFLLYSLMWRKFEVKKGSQSSLLNFRVAIFYALSIIIVLLDYLWSTLYFMFTLQIIIFLYASIISFTKINKNKQRQFPKLYFIAMLLALFAWALNALVILLGLGLSSTINIYIFNLIFFFLFLYGVVKVTM